MVLFCRILYDREWQLTNPSLCISILFQVDLDPNIDLNAEAKWVQLELKRNERINIKNLNCFDCRLNGAEILQLSEDMINPKRTKLGPQDFELKKVLGRGGYGKVFQVSQIRPKTILKLASDRVWKLMKTHD